MIVLRTTVDAMSDNVCKRVFNVYHSRKIRDGVSKTADLIGVPGGAIFPIYNYSIQSETDRDINLLAASALLYRRCMRPMTASGSWRVLKIISMDEDED